MKKKNDKTIIVCVRGQATVADIERIFGPREKEPMTSISCGIGGHEDCGGEGCECVCHKPPYGQEDEEDVEITGVEGSIRKSRYKAPVRG